MDAARWCFVLICHTLLTEREEDRVRARKRARKTKRGVYWLQSWYSAAEKRLPPFKSSLNGLFFLISLCMCLSCLNGSDGAAMVALCQAGCILPSTDTTPRRSANLASIEVHLSSFYKNTIDCMFFLKGGPEKWKRRDKKRDKKALKTQESKGRR